MVRVTRFVLAFVLITILQVSIIPVFLDHAFFPNLYIILVCYLALRAEQSWSGLLGSYLAGIVHGAFNGFYFGLSALNYLVIYLVLKKVSDQLYTESPHLIAVAVFIAAITDSLLSLLLITILSNASEVYRSLLTYMFPQAVVTALAAAIYFNFRTWSLGRKAA